MGMIFAIVAVLAVAALNELACRKNGIPVVACGISMGYHC